VDFEKNSETNLDTRIITIPGENSKYLEIAAHILRVSATMPAPIIQQV